MIFPDQSPIVLIAVVIGLLAVALFAAARDLGRRGGELACPQCGLAFDPARWTAHNERTLYHGRNTVTPTYTCPRCGQTVRKNSA